jgi:hypothetical protein
MNRHRHANRAQQFRRHLLDSASVGDIRMTSGYVDLQRASASNVESEAAPVQFLGVNHLAPAVDLKASAQTLSYWSSATALADAPI